MKSDPRVGAANAALDEQRFDQAIMLFTALYDDAERADGSGEAIHFITMFGWRLLLEAYPPAHATMRALRDVQVQRLLAGDLLFGPPRGPRFSDGSTMQKTRFSVIVAMNRMLQDDRATATLFAHLDATQPDLARRYGHAVLTLLVATGNLALADKYRGDPLASLDEVNALTPQFALFPAPSAAPRLAATLTTLVTDVSVAMAVLAGAGQTVAAQALRDSMLAGLADGALRTLADRELAEPGTISRALVAHQMAQD